MTEDTDLSHLAKMIDFSKEVEVTLSFDSSDEELDDGEDIIKFEIVDDERKYINENINIVQDIVEVETNKEGEKIASSVEDTLQNPADPKSSSANSTLPADPKSSSANSTLPAEPCKKTDDVVFAPSSNCQTPNDMKFEKHALLIVLLKDISNTLITIARARQECKAASTCSLESFDRTRTIYLKLKRHLFNMSLATIKQIVLPNQRNEPFMKSFVKYTTAKAKFSNNKNEDQTWMTEINNIFNELILWTSHAQDETNNLLQEMAEINYSRTKSNLVNNNKTLVNLINKPPILPQATTNVTINNTTMEENRCSLKFGPPESEITICFNPHVLNSQTPTTIKPLKPNQQRQCVPNPRNKPTRPKNNSRKDSNLGKTSPDERINSSVPPPPLPPAYTNSRGTEARNQYNLCNNYVPTNNILNNSVPNPPASNVMQNLFNYCRNIPDQTNLQLANPYNHQRVFTDNVNKSVQPGVFQNYNNITERRDPVPHYQSNMIQSNCYQQNHPNRYYPYPQQKSWSASANNYNHNIPHNMSQALPPPTNPLPPPAIYIE